MGNSDNNNRIELKKIVEISKEKGLKIKTFLEVGSMTGDDSMYIKSHLGLEEKDVFIVEAHPLFFKNICSKYPNFICVNNAAWKESGKINFNAAMRMDDGRSSILTREDCINDFFKVEVCAKRLDELIETTFKTSIDACKIDVEGATLEVLKGFGQKLKDLKILQIETEQKIIWNDQKIHNEVSDFLKSNGFIKVWEILLGKTQIDSIWIRNED